MTSRPIIVRDRGVTLPELLIVLVLMGVIATVISAAIVVTLRSAPAVGERADAAVNVQGLVTWLPPDVDSARPGSFETDPAVASGCAGTDPGFNLLKVAWHEQIGGATTEFVANYRYVAVADGGYIMRLYCSGSGALGTPATLRATGLIPPWVAGAEPVRLTLTDSPADADSLVDSVRFELDPVEGKTIVVEATTKNPNETLPPTSLSPTTAPASTTTSTTTTTTTTTIPEGTTTTIDPALTTTTTTTSTTTTTTTIPPCVIGSMVVSPSTMSVKKNDEDSLKNDVTVTITVTGGYCVGLTLQYETGAANGQYVRNFNDSGTTRTLVLPGHPSPELWALGERTLEVKDSTLAVLASQILTVTK